jgi:hypothetical protein
MVARRAAAARAGPVSPGGDGGDGAAGQSPGRDGCALPAPPPSPPPAPSPAARRDAWREAAALGGVHGMGDGSGRGAALDTSARAGRPPATGVDGVPGCRRGLAPDGPGRALPGVAGKGVAGKGVMGGAQGAKGDAVSSLLRRALDGLVPAGGRRRTFGDGWGVRFSMLSWGKRCVAPPLGKMRKAALRDLASVGPGDGEQGLSRVNVFPLVGSAAAGESRERKC